LIAAGADVFIHRTAAMTAAALGSSFADADDDQTAPRGRRIEGRRILDGEDPILGLCHAGGAHERRLTRQLRHRLELRA
jgi:hypothetical protein